MYETPIFSKVTDHDAYAELRQALPSQIPAIPSALDQTLDFLAQMRDADGSEIEIEVALGEAITNAVVHGNRERSAKRVFVTCRCTRDGDVSITVQDEGQGFDSDLEPALGALDNRFGPSGRGIHLMRRLMDAVHFNDKGTAVHMLKRSKVHLIAEGRTR